MNIIEILSKELKIGKNKIERAVELIDEGNTIPFIARYRKEMTGNMSDVELRSLNDRLKYLRSLEERKSDVERLIDEQGKLTEDISLALKKALTLQEVEDIYLPYKKKKSTRASKAKERGLEPLANHILSGSKNIEELASGFVDPEKEVEDVKAAIEGASDIIAEMISEDANLRKIIRDELTRRGMIETKAAKSDEEEPEKVKSVYHLYYDYSENVSTIVPHRVLAINRGEKEGFLRVKLEADSDKIVSIIEKRFINNRNRVNEELLKKIAADAYKRLIFPSIEREIRSALTETAHEQAISVFAKNVDGLLMQPPIHGKVVMGFDPAYRTGCKIAVVDASGKLLDYTTVYPTEPQKKVRESEEILINMINKCGVDIIAIGNGTASRESEKFVSEMLTKIKRRVQYVIVNEAGASVYSASELANEEHPDINVSIRGAISIARRLQDPMAELVKIDPKSIGVGQYQHDLNKKRLEEVVGGVVEDAVNRVGVDLNTASSALLQYVAGMSKTIAQNVVDYRNENGEFKDINELHSVKRLGPQAFKQSSGFLRIVGGVNPLDNTGVHPESYEDCDRIFELLHISEDDFGKSDEIKKRVDEYGMEKLSEDTGVGAMTLEDIVKEISKPGRDIREQGEMPILRTDVLSFDDISEGMELKGTVRNVVDFGAFVDIGIKDDGLIHISKMSRKRIKHPLELLKVGDIVDVRVINKDEVKHRIGLELVNKK